MSKAKRRKGERRPAGRGVWTEIADRLTANFQRELRKSELWDQMVAEFGEKRAEQILRACKAEVRPGLAPDERGDRPTDIS